MVDAGAELVSQAAPAVQQAVQAAAPAVQQAVQQSAPFQFIFWLPVVAALTILIGIELVKALPWSEKALAARPLSCRVCLISWGTIVLAALATWQLGFTMAFFHIPCAGGITLLLSALLERLKGPELVPPTTP